MSRALSASCAPGTTRNRLSFTALSMIWRKLAGIERLRDCRYVSRRLSHLNSSPVRRTRPARDDETLHTCPGRSAQRRSGALQTRDPGCKQATGVPHLRRTASRCAASGTRALRSAGMIFVAVDIGGTFTDLIGFDDEARRVRPGQEPDHAGASWRRASSTASARAALERRRDRRADPRLDHRHQHADRAQGRQDRPDRHARHARRLHHRPRQPAGSLQPVLPPPPAAGVAPAHARGRRARAGLRRGRRRRCSRRASPRPARR